MTRPISRRLVTRLLTALLIFGAVSSFGGAVLGIVFNGAGVPLEYLANSSFSSYAGPGLILGVVVGGTQLGAAIALLRSRPSALLLSAIAGFGMIIWVFVELAVILAYSFLQALYFALGTLELVLAFALLNIVPGMVSPARTPVRADRPSNSEPR